ncbi:MAG: Response regulator PleD [Candidatus Marinimicrobia bacterium]|nr:Response regulator PleD [Candidatus Neomarinimicrobiota bacterium]
MPSGGNIRLYFILAIIFGVLAIGIFLYPGVPPTGLGWVIKALVLLAFGVYLWLLLQDLQVNAIAAAEAEQTDHTPSQQIVERESLPLSQLEIDFQSSQDEDSPEHLDATEAYNAFLNRLLRVIHETLVSNAAMLYIVDSTGGNLVLQEAQVNTGSKLREKVDAGKSILDKAFTENNPVLISDFSEETADYYGTDSPDIQSFLAVPLRYHGQAIGVLAVDDSARESYSPEDSKLLEQYAEIISAAMVQLDSLDQLTDEKRLFARLCQFNSQLSLTDSQDDLLNQILRVCGNLFDYDSITVVLLQSQHSSQAEVAAVDGSIKHPGKGYRFELQDSILSQVIQSGEPQVLTDIQNSDEVKEFLPELRGEFTDVQSLLIVPVKSHSETFGAIVLESRMPRAFSKQEQDILLMVGSVFGAGLNRFYLYRYMKNIASKDEMTGVANYRAFKERLEEEIQRSDRYQTQFTLFITDLDKFKRINDTHGHLYGDYMLKEVASIIENSVRTIDLVARYGGEEFAAILVNTNVEDSEKTANRIRESIKNYHFEKNNIKERITISIGVAEYPSHAKEVEALIECADEAMYQVKQIGGNAVQIYQHDAQIKEA